MSGLGRSHSPPPPGERFVYSYSAQNAGLLSDIVSGQSPAVTSPQIGPNANGVLPDYKTSTPQSITSKPSRYPQHNIYMRILGRKGTPAKEIGIPVNTGTNTPDAATRGVYLNSASSTPSPLSYSGFMSLFSKESGEERQIRYMIKSYRTRLTTECQHLKKATQRHQHRLISQAGEFDTHEGKLVSWGLKFIIPHFRMQAWCRLSRSSLVAKLSEQLEELVQQRAQKAHIYLQIYDESANRRNKYSVAEVEEFCVAPELLAHRDADLLEQTQQLGHLDLVCASSTKRFMQFETDYRWHDSATRRKILLRILRRYKTIPQIAELGTIEHNLSWTDFCVWLTRRNIIKKQLEDEFSDFVEDQREKEGRLFYRWHRSLYRAKQEEEDRLNRLSHHHTGNTGIYSNHDAATKGADNVSKGTGTLQSEDGAEAVPAVVAVHDTGISNLNTNRSIIEEEDGTETTTSNGTASNTNNTATPAMDGIVALHVTPFSIKAFIKYFANDIIGVQYSIPRDCMEANLALTEALFFKRIHSHIYAYSSTEMRIQDLQWRLKCQVCRYLDPRDYHVPEEYFLASDAAAIQELQNQEQQQQQQQEEKEKGKEKERIEASTAGSPLPVTPPKGTTSEALQDSVQDSVDVVGTAVDVSMTAVALEMSGDDDVGNDVAASTIISQGNVLAEHLTSEMEQSPPPPAAGKEAEEGGGGGGGGGGDEGEKELLLEKQGSTGTAGSASRTNVLAPEADADSSSMDQVAPVSSSSVVVGTRGILKKQQISPPPPPNVCTVADMVSPTGKSAYRHSNELENYSYRDSHDSAGYSALSPSTTTTGPAAAATNAASRNGNADNDSTTSKRVERANSNSSSSSKLLNRINAENLSITLHQKQPRVYLTEDALNALSKPTVPITTLSAYSHHNNNNNRSKSHSNRNDNNNDNGKDNSNGFERESAVSVSRTSDLSSNPQQNTTTTGSPTKARESRDGRASFDVSCNCEMCTLFSASRRLQRLPRYNKFQHGRAYARSSRVLSLLTLTSTPREIIGVLTMASKWLLRDAIDVSGSREIIGADLLIPLFTMVLIHAQLPNVHMILKVLEDYAEYNEQGNISYAIANLEGSVLFIKELAIHRDLRTLFQQEEAPLCYSMYSAMVAGMGLRAGNGTIQDVRVKYHYRYSSRNINNNSNNYSSDNLSGLADQQDSRLAQKSTYNNDSNNEQSTSDIHRNAECRNESSGHTDLLSKGMVQMSLKPTTEPASLSSNDEEVAAAAGVASSVPHSAQRDLLSRIVTLPATTMQFDLVIPPAIETGTGSAEAATGGGGGGGGSSGSDDALAMKQLGEWLRDQNTMEDTITILQKEGWMA